MRVLILEDEMMIGFAHKDLVGSLGFEAIGPYGTVESALQALKTKGIEFALLDINLGEGQTSEPFAEALMDLSIPFAFVTGYGSAAPLQDKFRDVDLIEKPLRAKDLLEAISPHS